MGIGDGSRSLEFCYSSNLYVLMPIQLWTVILDKDIIIDLVRQYSLWIGPSLVCERISRRQLPRSDPTVPCIDGSFKQMLGLIRCSLAAESYQAFCQSGSAPEKLYLLLFNHSFNQYYGARPAFQNWRFSRYRAMEFYSFNHLIDAIMLY